MLSKVNPGQFIRAHWRSFTNDATGKVSKPEIFLHALLPGGVALLYLWRGDGISENAASIIVSAASIAAGLLLNLLVLIYTLVYNAKSANQPIRNLSAFKQVCDEALATVAYSILLSLALVLSAFLSLNPQGSFVNAASQFTTVYLGSSIVLCILIILKRVYALVHFEFVR